MRVIYTYDVAGIREANRKFCINHASSRITYDELKSLLISDGAALNESSELRYYNESLKTFCTFPQFEALSITGDLKIKIKRGYSWTTSDFINEIEILKKRCEDTKQTLDERERKLKFLNRSRDSGARAPWKELDIVMLHASPLVQKSQPFEEPCLNFLQEINLMVQQVNRSATVRFEIATPENLKELLEYHSKIVIISCEGFINDNGEFVLAVEKVDNLSEIGELIEMTVEELKKLLSGNRFNQIVIIKSKKFKEIGKIFIDVGISIVLAVKETEDSSTSMKFIIDVVNNLLDEKSIEEFQESLEYDHPEFQLFYTDENMKHQKFCNSVKEGALEVLSENNPQFKLVPVHKFTVGRRSEVRKVIKGILENRCVNITGPCGIGKTMVLRRAAQYLYERRIFKAGVVYLDVCMRTDIIFLYRYLAGIMNLPLSDQMSLPDNEKLLSMMNHIDVLFIVDNIDRLNNKEKIVRDVNKIMAETDKPKIIIGSKTHLGVADSFNYEIPLLSLNQSKALLTFHNKSILTDLDEIVAKIGQKPSDLLQVSPLLSDPLFKSDFLQIESKYLSIESSIFHVQKTFPNFLTFLRLLSYLPSGALKLNLEELTKNLLIKPQEILRYLNKDSGAWFIHTDPAFEFVVLRSYVMDYMTFVVPHDPDLAKACLVHLAVFIRSLLKAFLASSDPISFQCRGSLFFINAGIDTGIWGAAFPEDSAKMTEKIQFTDLVKTFEKCESNFWYYLNSRLIKEIFQVKDLKDVESETGKAIGEILLCTTAIFILMGKKDDALIMISKGRELCADLGMKKVKALLTLTNASLYSSRKYDKNLKQPNYPSKNFEKAKHLALKAKWKLSDYEEGLAESSFLLNLLQLKVKTSSHFYPILPLRKAQSSTVEEEADTEHVINLFEKVNQKVGSARARLGFCKFIIKEQIEPKTIQDLEDSIKVFDEENYPYWKTRAQLCLARCYLEGSNWIKSREILNSIEQTQKDINRVAIDRYLHEVNEKIKLNNRHAISFFSSSPLVDFSSIQMKRIRPTLRISENLAKDLEEDFKNLNKQFCFRAEILTRDCFFKFLQDRPMIIHLNSCCFRWDLFSFESQEGAVDFLTFDEFESLCSGDLRAHGVEMIVLAFPLSASLGRLCYERLKVRHVVCFNLIDFSYDGFPVQVRITLEKGIQTFCKEFYLKLLEGLSVRESFHYAREAMNFRIDEDLIEYGSISIDGICFGQLWKDLVGNEPVLINFETDDHDSDLLTMTMPDGEPIMMSLPPGPINFEASNSFFVGRQIEMFKAIQDLRKQGCVVIEGDKGIGKTEFVKQICSFLNQRKEFKDRIVYISIQGKSMIEDIYHLLKTNGIGVFPGYYLANGESSKNTLVILDDCEDFSSQSPHLFSSLIKFLRIDCQISLLLSSSIHIKPLDFLIFSKIQLYPLNDAECRALLSISDLTFYKENYQEEDQELIPQLSKIIIQLSKRVPGEITKLLKSQDLSLPSLMLQRLRFRYWHLSHNSESELNFETYTIAENEEEESLS
jgi:hypothetical protein